MLEREQTTAREEVRRVPAKSKKQRRDYQQKESHSMLERLYGNSLKNFVNSLYQGKHMDQGDIRELSDFLKEMEQNLEEH